MTCKQFISSVLLCAVADFAAAQNAPVITSQPQSQTNCAGTDVTFNVAALGTEPLYYRWRRNGINLLEGGNAHGTTNATLSITNVQKFNAGSYTVVVSNAWGRVTSQPAMLVVIGPVQKLVNEASPNQTIELPAGTYFDNVIIEKNLTLQGATASKPIIDGSALANVFIVASNSTVILRHLAISNGYSSYLQFLSDGAAVQNWGTLTLDECEITGNRGSGAGTLANFGGSLILTNCLVANNHIDTSAGLLNHSGTVVMVNTIICSNRSSELYQEGVAIANHGLMTVNRCVISTNRSEYEAGHIIGNTGTLTMTNTTVQGNSAWFEDVIYNTEQLILDSCNIINNIAGRGAGGLSNRGLALVTRCSFIGNESGFSSGTVENGGFLTLMESDVSGNFSQNGEPNPFGGAGLKNWGTGIVVNCTISSNTLAGPYGRIYGAGIANSDVLALTNCTISGNHERLGSPVSGGGIFNTGVLCLAECTVYGNSAQRGGGIFNAGTATLRNTIVAGNFSTANEGHDILGPVNSLGYDLIQRTNDAVITNILAGNIYGVDPLLGPLRDNGGPTRTHALLPDSPAIDAGPTDSFVQVDQRGISRPQDGDGDCEAVSDIGAFEKEKALRLTIRWLADSRVRLFLEGLPDKNYGVQATTSLVPAQWSSPMPMNAGSIPCIYEFEDGPLGTPSHRFYRAVELP